jgi:hypothetical protein
VTGVRRLRRGLILAAGAAAMALSACGPAYQKTSAPAAPLPSCEGVKQDACRQLTDPGAGPVRYALLGPARSTGDPVVLVDLGGPGISLFGRHWPDGLAAELGPRYAGLRLAVLEEPWVRHDQSDACRRVSARFLTGMRTAPVGGPFEPPASVAAAGGELTGVCGTGWGWTPQRFAAAVRAVERAERVHITGYVGVSFGARRLGYLESVPGWAVLADPAPRTMTAAEYLDARHDAALAALARRCPECGSGPALTARLDALARTLDAHPVPVRARSVPLTGPDLGAALLSLAYQPDPVARRAGRALTSAVGTEDRLLGTLADLVWNRYGTMDLSPAYLAYAEETCPSLAGWRRALARPAPDPVAAVLARIHAPCLAARAPAVPPVPVPADTCVSNAAEDGVAPSSFADTWRDVSLRITRPGGGHGDGSGIAACLDALSARRAARGAAPVDG